MHHTAQYNFPAPILTGRGGPTMAGHYNSYNPRITAAPTVVTSPAVATQTTPATSTRASTTEFRGSTNPSEDWTKISDLAERRRIQNRIAQRNYRKKLKRRLEDLERRAQSRSLSPNGEESGDGRSTRESSSDNQNSSATTTSTRNSSAAPGDTITVSAHPHSNPVTASYEYAPTYSTATSATPYPSQYRTAGAYPSAGSSQTHYATSTYDPASNQFIYSHYNDQHHHSSHLPPPTHTHQSPHYTTPDSAVDPNLLLPLPPLMSSSANTTPTSSASSSPAQRSIPGTSTMGLKTQGLYDLDNSHSPASSTAIVSPYVLTNGYDAVHEQQYTFSPAGISSSYYNLDYSAPLPPLLGHSSNSSSPATPSSTSPGRYIKKENPW